MTREELHKAGTVLDIGGSGSGMGWGCNAIEIRVSAGGVGWEWRLITDTEKQQLIDTLNALAVSGDLEEDRRFEKKLLNAEYAKGAARAWRRRALALIAQNECEMLPNGDTAGYGPVWRCDGFTHDGKGGPLVACTRSYRDATIAGTVSRPQRAKGE
jgi:hypothetical protein